MAGINEKTKPYSEATAGEIDVQVQSIMREAYKRCEDIDRAFGTGWIRSRAS